MSVTAGTDERAPASVYARSPWRRAFRQPVALVGLLIVVVWLVIMLTAPLVSRYDPLAQEAERLEAPSDSHWFGTDRLGRDVFSRVLFGARVSLPLAMMLVSVAGFIGVVIGAVAGYFGGWSDNLLMRLADLLFAFPSIILAMAVVAALGPGLFNAVMALVLVAWPGYARVTRSLVLTAREAEFVHVARLLGTSTSRILALEVMPNVIGPVLVLSMLELGSAVLLLSGLSFLGLGAQPPTAEWGSMVAQGAQNFDRWWVGLFPGLAILSVVMAFNFIGDSLRDLLDPRTSRSMEAGGA